MKIDQRHLPASFEVKSEPFELHISGAQCALIPKFAKRPSTVEVIFLQSPGADKQERHYEEEASRGHRD